MRHYRCQCGAWEAWGDTRACQGCEDCGTGAGGEPREPHAWERRFHERTGKPYELCRQCLARRGWDAAKRADAGGE